jgi:hypothetical protein
MFKKLKEKISTTLTLKFLDFSKSFEMHINASGFTIESVLMEDKHLITFESKKIDESPIKKANS